MKKYYFFDGTTQHGPFTFEELKAKQITAQTSVWFNPMPQWKPAGEIDELKNLFSTAAPSATPGVASAPNQEDWNNKLYYFIDNAGKQNGPFKLNQLAGQNISAQTSVWYDPLPKWTTAGEVSVLKDIIKKTTATITTTPAPQTKQEDWINKLYFFIDSTGKQNGPFKLNELEGKNISAQTSVWYDPLPKWTTAGELPALKDIINKPASASKDEDWNNKLFFITDATGTQQGPFKLEQLKEKNIESETAIWYDPLPKWTTAGEVPTLKDIIFSQTSDQLKSS